MTFLASWRLVFIVAPVALLAAYLLAQRSRRKAAVRFSSVDLLASVAPRRPAWQRHLPAAAFLLALRADRRAGRRRPAQSTNRRDRRYRADRSGLAARHEPQMWSARIGHACLFTRLSISSLSLFHMPMPFLS